MSVPCASISDVMVSAPTQIIRAGHSRAAVVSRTSAAAASMPWIIWPRGPSSCGAGACHDPSVSAIDRATAPSGSGDSTTTGNAPPAHARSTSRRTRGWPSVSASAPSVVADRITAATVIGSIVAAS